MIKVIQKRSDNCKLKNCTPGLFYYKNILCVKLQGIDECYIVDSYPEFFYYKETLCIKIKNVNDYIKNRDIFWGGTNSKKMRNQLEVTPVTILENNFFSNVQAKKLSTESMTKQIKPVLSYAANMIKI
jgi:hypothetical protein